MTVAFMMEKQVFWGHTVKFFAKKWCDGVFLAARFVLRGLL
jgi:rhamnogalacturonyl hydrolase YesR